MRRAHRLCSSREWWARCDLPTLRALTRSSRVVPSNRLGLEILLETELAPFAAVAGLFVATERRAAVVGHALQDDIAGADLATDAAGILDRRTIDIAGKAIGGVVGDARRGGLVLGADDGEHRTKDLLARDRHLIGHAGEDGRTDIEALVVPLGQARTTGHQGRTFLDAHVDQRLDLVPLDAVDDRADGRALCTWFVFF